MTFIIKGSEFSLLIHPTYDDAPKKIADFLTTSANFTNFRPA